MLIPKPSLNRLAADTIAALAKDGIVCAPDEVLWLNEMAEKLTRPTPCDPDRFFDYPTLCGNVALWPLSIGAKQWLRAAVEWFGDNDRIYILAQAYAMAHGRDMGHLLALNTRIAAAWKILAWSRTLNCSLSELARAIDSMTDRDSVDIPTPKEEAESKNGIARRRHKTDWGEIGALLLHYYPGHSLEYWLWEVSDDLVAILLEKYGDFTTAEPGQGRSAKDRHFLLFSEFRLVVKHIRESRRSAQGQDVHGRGHVDPGQRPPAGAGPQPNGQGRQQEDQAPGDMAAQKLAGAGNQQGGHK